MRIRRDYFSAIKRFFNWFFSRFKPLTVHTEAVVINKMWERVKGKVNTGKVLKWYVMTPANSDYFKSEFNINLPKEKISRILEERYKWMIQHKQKLELHVHFSMIMGNMSYKEQEKLLKEAVIWFKKKLGIAPKEIVPGWWSYNEDTLKLCRKYGLKMVREEDYDYTHDFDFF